MKYMLIALAAVVIAGALFLMFRNKTESVAVAYRRISQEEAKSLMRGEEPCTILDVRTKEEYDNGHIPDAVLLPLDKLRDSAEAVLSDKDRMLLVYCRSGNRSRSAAKILTELGYSDVREFGGINTWPYDIVK